MCAIMPILRVLENAALEDWLSNILAASLLELAEKYLSLCGKL